jgi:hypothetical protein
MTRYKFYLLAPLPTCLLLAGCQPEIDPVYDAYIQCVNVTAMPGDSPSDIKAKRKKAADVCRKIRDEACVYPESMSCGEFVKKYQRPDKG